MSLACWLTSGVHLCVLHVKPANHVRVKPANHVRIMIDLSSVFVRCACSICKGRSAVINLLHETASVVPAHHLEGRVCSGDCTTHPLTLFYMNFCHSWTHQVQAYVLAGSSVHASKRAHSVN
jgi:hypothetical protein